MLVYQELRRWTKDPQNPVAGALSDLGQIWANGAGRWDGMSGGQMFSTNDSTLHSWYKQAAAHGFPRGGSGVSSGKQSGIACDVVYGHI